MNNISFSNSPSGRRHLTNPYISDPQKQKLPKVGEHILISDQKRVPGFQQKTSSGTLWRPLEEVQGETEMKVLSVLHNQTFDGHKAIRAECSIKGYSFVVIAYFRKGMRVA